MKDYFSAKNVHLEARCLLSAAPRVPLVATCGVDNQLFTLNPADDTENTYELVDSQEYAAMVLAPDGSHCLLAQNKSVKTFSLETKEVQNLVEVEMANGAITSLNYGNSGNVVAVGMQQGKDVLLQPRTGRMQKCRPGHKGPTTFVLLDPNEQYLASIGQDQNVLVYKLSPVEAPQEMIRCTITKLQDCSTLSLSFHNLKEIIFLPGQRYLQKLEMLNNRWELTKSQLITHGQKIIHLTQTVKENTLVTSSEEQVCIWNIKTQQKLFEVEEFPLKKTIALAGTFFGMRDDGNLYRYIRNIKQEEPMDIEQHRSEEGDRIDFESAEEQVSKQPSERNVVQFQRQKKSKVDKMITCLPQGQITSATSLFEAQRFLFVNQYGTVILKQDANQEISVEVEFGLQEPRRVILSTRNRGFQFFDINPYGIVYASDKQFGLRKQTGIQGENWQVSWNGIKAVAMGTGWLAIANEEQIKVFDLCCHEIRSIGFDREIIALRAHQNMLVAVYHQSVPMFGSQQISMQLFLVDQSARSAHLIANLPVPIRPGSTLRSIHFSTQGMLISQDVFGIYRVFSLQRQDWTTVGIVGLDDARKAWAIGVVNYELLFWRTSTTDPQPTVAPRFLIESATFTIPTIGIYPQNTQQTYERLLWQRFVLDHEKARSRLWGKLKVARNDQHIFYDNVRTIYSEKEIALKHEQLDMKFSPLITTYLKNDDSIRALQLAKTCVRSLDSKKNFIELFDSYNKRQESIKMEQYYFEQKQEVEYYEMQVMEFVQMRRVAETVIKPKSNDIMRKPARRLGQAIPTFSQSLSMSQEENHSNRLVNSQISMSSQPKSAVSEPQPEFENPFVKKKASNELFEAKKKEISEDMEKYGIKKKVDEKNGKKTRT